MITAFFFSHFNTTHIGTQWHAAGCLQMYLAHGHVCCFCLSLYTVKPYRHISAMFYAGCQGDKESDSLTGKSAEQ